MNLLKRKPSLMLLLVAALLILLPLLAVLQYRWLGEVSAAERERMQANLKTSAERFCADFDRELTSAFVQLQSPILPNSDQPAADFASRYRRWRASAPNPNLISDIYRSWFDETGQLKLVRFNASSNVFEPVEWPEKLLPVRRRFELQNNTQESTHKILQSIFKQKNGLPEVSSSARRGFILQVSGGQTADDIPALIIPDIAHPVSPESLHSLNLQKRACTIAVLNDDLIKTEILPALINRYFSIDGANEYNLAVVRRGAKREIVFRSDAQMPLEAFDQSDAKGSLFKIRTDELDRIFVATTSFPPASPVPSAATEKDSAVQSGKGKSSRVAVRVLQSDVSVAETVKEAAPQEPGRKIEINRPLTIPFENESGWQLLVKHRAGSLDAAVGNIRRRNLFISFGILLLLGASVGFIVISSRRAQRLAAQQMEFVAGVSHELRTPLAVICSAAENLADGVIDNSDQIKLYGGLIRDEGRRLTGMVEQVLEFAGAQSGRKTYELRQTDLSRVIEDAIAACHLQLQEGGFVFEKHIAEDLPPINADAAALSRAIQNLLHNAMKYSGDNRWIGLSVKLDNPPDCPAEIRIKVSDRGIGIAPSELAHIFEPFYRGKEVVASQIHGNGLGLSLVKHIVEAHGGKVSVESKAGQGSEFTLQLPIAPAVELKAETSQENYEQTHLAR